MSGEPQRPQSAQTESSAESPPRPSPQQVTLQAWTTYEEFHGPIPPPAYLREYEQIAPGAAKQLIEMADRQSQHRQELETLVVAGKDRRATHGLYIGGFLALLVAVFGFVLVLSGRSVAGFGTLVAEAGTLAGVFIVGRTQQRKERLEKARLAPLPPTPSQQPQLPFRPIEDARGP